MTSLRQVNEALLRLVRLIREGRSIRVAIGAVLASLAVGAVAIAAVGVDLRLAISALMKGSLGSGLALGNTAVKTTPILCAGLGVLVAFRAGLWNIGAEGQLLSGAVAAALVGLYVTGLPSVVILLLMLAAGAVGGGLWGAVPGALRAYLGLNEIITTLFLSFIAIFGVSYLASGPLKDPLSGGYPWTAALPAQARLPLLPIGPGITSGLLLALLCAVGVAVLLGLHRLGQDWRSLGGGRTAALFSGIPVKRRIVQAMAFSGGMAGVGGVSELAGAQYRLSVFFSQGYGFDAIVVAIVGGLTSGGAVLAALFFGGLRAGADSMERVAAVPSSIAELVQGLTVAFIVVAYGTRLVRRRQRRAGSS